MYTALACTQVLVSVPAPLTKRLHIVDTARLTLQYRSGTSTVDMAFNKPAGVVENRAEQPQANGRATAEQLQNSNATHAHRKTCALIRVSAHVLGVKGDVSCFGPELFFTYRQKIDSKKTI